MAIGAFQAGIPYVCCPGAVRPQPFDGPDDMPQIVTANRLIDGDVVFRAPGGDWVRDVNGAEVLADKAAAAVAEAAALADLAAAKVVDVAVIDVTVQDGAIVPVRLRERIRAFGPTVKSDHRADLKPFADA